MTTRLRLGIVSIVALLTLAFTATFSSVAGAGLEQVGFDPLNTNVPHLAWRGEQVRLVKCFDFVDENLVGRFLIEDWSGDPFQRPQMVDNDEYVNWFSGGNEQSERQCFATELVSLKAGMAIVKLKVIQDTPGGATVLEHQFLVAWMNIASATLGNIGDLTHQLGDTTPNHLQVLVTGSIPMGGNFSELGLGTELTMPHDWAALASRFARSNIPGRERDPCLWDIHDELSWEGPGPDVHGASTVCTLNRAAGADDNVDNSTGGDEFGPFSRAVAPWNGNLLSGDNTGNDTIGPFDPTRPDATYLPDGVLDAGDAPMPSARIDYHLTGDGMLVEIDKHDVYQTARGAAGIAHDLYAPFYATYLPATAAGNTSSGVSQGFANNFTGIMENGVYHYWDHTVAISRNAASSACPPFSPGIPAAGPSGVFEVTVYSDEHGEARVGFLPGTGVNLFANFVPDANGGCDLQGINPIGSGHITADARYPSQPVTVADVPATPSVTKTITSAFNKTITCVPKFPALGTTGNFAFICTVTAIGANGQPFAGEVVCFITNAEAIMAYNVVFQQTVVPDPDGALPPRLCLVLNGNGQAQVEIIGKGALNIIAHFTDEELFRIAQINALPPGASGATTTPVTSTQSPTPAQIVSLGGQVTPNQPGATNQPGSKPATVKAAKLASAKLVTKKGVRKLVVRVNSPAKKAKIKVVLRVKGKKVATAVRTIKTNRAVTVGNLKIGKKVNRISVSVVR